MSEVSKSPLRRSLRALTHGIYVLSASHDGADEYVVLSLVSQCSVEPPRVALALSVNARMLRTFRAAGSGVLGILGAGDIPAVRRYGAPGGMRHAPSEVVHTANGHPVPAEARFALELVIASEHLVGDHVLFVCDATGATAFGDEPFVPFTLAASGLPYAG
ncbi:MAG: flavin reductase family protein [Gemmatimonas sp.]